MKKNRTSWGYSNRGFSLIELIFTVIFLTIIITGAIKLQTSGFTMGNTQSNEVEAHFLANQGLEIAKGTGSGSFCAPPCDNSTDVIGDFTRVIRIEDDSYLVKATVTWEDSSGEHSVEAKRVIFE